MNMDFSLVPSILKPLFSYKCLAVSLQHSTVSSSLLIPFSFAQQFSISKKMYRFLYLYNLSKCLLQYMLYEESD